MNGNPYQEAHPAGGAEVSALNRRDFFKLVGGGITIFFTLGEPLSIPGQRSGRQYPDDFNAYLRIGEDGRVSCFTGKIEMGQGIITSLAQMLAEELDVSLDSVDMVMGDTSLCPYDSATVGSRSTKYFGPPLRRAAAEAKGILLELAAERLQVPRAGLRVGDGVITDGTTMKKVTYAQLAGGKRIERHLQGEAPLKPHSRHSVSGKPTRRTDSRQKVTGEAQFAADIRLPGMLHAKILRPPAHGAKLKTLDVSAAEKIDGAKVIQDGDLVAVLHEHPDEAERALASIKADFDVPESALDDQNIFEHLESSPPHGDIVTERGNPDDGRKLAAKVIEATYYNHYVAHAAMEPHAAVVHIGKDETRVWASTQAPFRVRDSVARILGLPDEKVHVITPFVGGGFGGKTWIQQAEEAARLAKLAGRPVQVAWSRKEEFFYDTFRPAAVIKGKSGLDQAGRIVYWDFEILFAGTRSSEPIYDIPHQRVFARGAWRGTGAHPFNVGAWRGPGSNTNVFAMESQTDAMAQAAGMDPLSFRLKNLADKRMRRVLEAAAEKFGGTFSKGPSGKGYGIACTDYLNTYVATIAEVKVDRNSGTVRVERVVCAEDMGEIINPDGARLQIEGSIVMGLGYVLAEEVQFKGGRVLDENFDTYEISRFSWVPRIETVLIDNPELAPQGCGEPTITTMGAVIANAVFDATGIRMYVLPMTPDRIKKAIQKSRA
jgi:CO/xanthine dehydrogenase Mo-binding subunit